MTLWTDILKHFNIDIRKVNYDEFVALFGGLLQLQENTTTKLKYVARTSTDFDTIKSLFEDNEELKESYTNQFWEKYKTFKFKQNEVTQRYSKIANILENWKGGN